MHPRPAPPSPAEPLTAAERRVMADLLSAYRQGAFPMADARHARGVEFYSADPRAIIPLTPPVPRPSRSLRAQARRSPLILTTDAAFAQVIRACADTPRAPRPGESNPGEGAPPTWINDWIIERYTLLHRAGHAHSIEAWLPAPRGGTPRLVGGLYGVHLGGAFFGESMFTAARPGPHDPESGASKLCFFALIRHLRAQGFALLDTQFANDHTTMLGAVTLPLRDYLAHVGEAVARDVPWLPWSTPTAQAVLQEVA